MLKKLLVLGSWFTALETHTENGPDCVQRVVCSWFLVHSFGNTERMEMIVLKELFVLGSWFTALETHRENGNDCVKRVVVLGSWFIALETHRENGADCVQRVAGSWFLVHSFENTQRKWT